MQEIIKSNNARAHTPTKIQTSFVKYIFDRSCDENYLLVKGDQYESKFCGSNKPNTYNVTGNTIKLSFKSGQQNEKNPGFVASYISGKGDYRADYCLHACNTDNGSNAKLLINISLLLYAR